MPETSGCQGKTTSRGDVVVQKDFKEVLGKLSGMLASLRCWWNYKEKTLSKKKLQFQRLFKPPTKLHTGSCIVPTSPQKPPKLALEPSSQRLPQSQTKYKWCFQSPEINPDKVLKIFPHETPIWKAAAKTLQVFLKIKEGIQDVEWSISLKISSYLALTPMPPPQKKTARSKPTELNHCYASLQHCQKLSSYKALGKHSARKAWK